MISRSVNAPQTRTRWLRKFSIPWRSSQALVDANITITWKISGQSMSPSEHSKTTLGTGRRTRGSWPVRYRTQERNVDFTKSTKERPSSPKRHPATRNNPKPSSDETAWHLKKKKTDGQCWRRTRVDNSVEYSVVDYRTAFEKSQYLKKSWYRAYGLKSYIMVRDYFEFYIHFAEFWWYSVPGLRIVINILGSA